MTDKFGGVYTLDGTKFEGEVRNLDDDKYKVELNDSIKKINQVTEDRLKKVQAGKK